MGISKKTVTVVSIAIVFAMGLGIAIGTTIKNKGIGISGKAPGTDLALDTLSPEELRGKLSDVMLPEEEFTKLSGAIFQTAMGLFMAQAQQAGIEVNETAQQELKKSIEDKYSRKYFADMNANSMSELTKPDLVGIISFYNTEAGQKFLKLSPKIIQSTMQTVQADLTQWLPKTVDALVTKFKNPTEEKVNGGDKQDLKANPKKEGKEGEAGEKS